MKSCTLKHYCLRYLKNIVCYLFHEISRMSSFDETKNATINHCTWTRRRFDFEICDNFYYLIVLISKERISQNQDFFADNPQLT